MLCYAIYLVVKDVPNEIDTDLNEIYDLRKFNCPIRNQISFSRGMALWCSVLAMLSYWLFTVLQRVGYPYDLNGWRGGMLIHA